MAGRATGAGGIRTYLRPAPTPSVILWLGGFALIIASWRGTATQAHFDRQLAFVNLAVAGLVVIGAGSILRVLELRRLVAARIRAIANESAANE